MLDAQNLTVLLFIAAAVAAVVFVFVYQKRQTSARIWRRIRTTYGKRPDREYDYDEEKPAYHLFSGASKGAGKSGILFRECGKNRQIFRV